jgi:diguanylate cyclase (GGDEF)-like protein
MDKYGPDFNVIARALRPYGVGLMWTESLSDGLSLLTRAKPALVLVGRNLPGLNDPTDLLGVIQAERLPTQVVVLDENPDFDESMDLVADGVFSVLASPVSMERLRRTAGRVLENHALFQTLLSSGAADHDPGDLYIYKNLAGHMEIRPLLEAFCATAMKISGAVGVEVRTMAELGDMSQVTVALGRTKRDVQREHNVDLAWLGRHLAAATLYFDEAAPSASLALRSFDELVFAGSLFLGQAVRFEETIKMASRDPLTGLCNRRVYLEAIAREYQQARRHNSPLSLLTLDLDHFKRINDTYGHQTGDEVLKWLAGVVKSVIRSGDLAARTGGEEFSIILPRTNLEQASVMAERLKQALAVSPMPPQLAAMRPTISQGLASLEHFLVNSSQDLIYWSDQAMYLAKREGRDTIRQIADLSMNSNYQDVQYVFQ